jgi:hypothetical protein
MKKVLLALVILAVGASMAQAQVTQVLSQNAVGYVKVDVQSNGLALAAVPFFDLEDTEYTVAEVIGDQLTGGFAPSFSDKLIKWDVGASAYITFWKNNSGIWQQFPDVGETTNTLFPGEGFWIVNNQDSNQTVYLMGEVPDSTSSPSNNIQILEGLQFASFPYPAEIAVSNLNLSQATGGFSPAFADKLLTWDQETKQYVTYWKKSLDNKWYRFPLSTPTDDTLKPGQGAWYVRVSGEGDFVWTEEKPYTWP